MLNRRTAQPASSQSGFTIVELMIATAVFSVVLLIITTGVISFSRQYYQGITRVNTQTVARNTVSEISQTIQFGTGSVTPMNAKGATQGLCVNGKPYYYVIGKLLNGSDGTEAKHVLVTSSASCSGLADVPVDIAVTPNLSSISSDAREILGKNMRLAYFAVQPPTSDTPATITIRIVYGDKDRLCSATVINSCQDNGTVLANSTLYATVGDQSLKCRSGSGNQFCAAVQLSTQVINRIQ